MWFIPLSPKGGSIPLYRDLFTRKVRCCACRVRQLNVQKGFTSSFVSGILLIKTTTGGLAGLWEEQWLRNGEP